MRCNGCGAPRPPGLKCDYYYLAAPGDVPPGGITFVPYTTEGDHSPHFLGFLGSMLLFLLAYSIYQYTSSRVHELEIKAVIVKFDTLRGSVPCGRSFTESYHCDRDGDR